MPDEEKAPTDLIYVQTADKMARDRNLIPKEIRVEVLDPSNWFARVKCTDETELLVQVKRDRVAQVVHC